MMLTCLLSLIQTCIVELNITAAVVVIKGRVNVAHKGSSVTTNIK